MPQYDTIELRAIHIDYPTGVRRIRISARWQSEERYDTWEIPNTTNLNQGQMIKAINAYYGNPAVGVVIPAFLKPVLTGPGT